MFVLLGSLLGCQMRLDLNEGGKSFEKIVADESTMCRWGYDSDGKQCYEFGDYQDAYFHAFEDIPDIDTKDYLGEYPSSNPHINISKFRYYMCTLTFDIKVVGYLNFIGKGLCEYSEVWTPSDPKLKVQCTKSDLKGDSLVGDTDYYSPTPIVWNKTERLFNVLESGVDGQFILYEGDTYIDAYVEGDEVHLIKRVPSIEDMGVFKLR